MRVVNDQHLGSGSIGLEMEPFLMPPHIVDLEEVLVGTWRQHPKQRGEQPAQGRIFTGKRLCDLKAQRTTLHPGGSCTVVTSNDGHDNKNCPLVCIIYI